MKIKRVEIVGFKSFVDKVSLDFQDGISGVVGPNGCGKSNIVDAIRWVMGEQNAKNLRGRFMEDVIFGGSESRKPLGMAEVSIIFSNQDGLAPPAYREYAEIMVTRRLFRNGESEYLINKTPCRLLDISELFMDTGVGARAYSIIEQGKIGMILNSKPEDRRYLIEEAAGVTKFKSRKKTALRKIEATRQNLTRLGDIISEVGRQAGSLKRQARKAERFKEFREELRRIETRFALERFGEFTRELAVVQAEEQSRRKSLEGLGLQLEDRELQLEEAKLQQLSREKEVSLGQERVFHLSSELQKVEGLIELGNRETANLTRERERIETEQQEVLRRFAELDAEEQELHRNKGTLGEDLETRVVQLAEAEKNLEELCGEESGAAAQMEEARRALYGLLSELSRFGALQEETRRRTESLEQRSAKNRSEVLSVREAMEEVRQTAAAREEALGGFREKKKELLEEMEQRREQMVLLRRRIEENEALLLVRREAFSRDRSRLESLRQLERSLEGYGTGVKTLMGDAGVRERLKGVVADVLEVPPRYEKAVEALLGERLQALLPLEHEDARSALELLARKGGRCRFVLPGFDAEQTLPVPGATALNELCKGQGPQALLVRSLLAGAWLVPSLQTFLAGAVPAGVTLVTEAGETLDFRGELQGGASAVLDQGLLHQKREIKELEVRVEVSAQEVETLQVGRRELQEQFSAAEEALRETQAALHRKELKVVDSEKDLARFTAELQRHMDRVEVLSFEDSQLHEEHEDLVRQQAEALARRQLRESRKADLELQVARVQEQQQVLKARVETLREQVTGMKITLVSLREREEGSRRAIERLGRSRRELAQRRVLLQQQLGQGAQQFQRLEQETGQHRVRLDILFQKRQEETRRHERLRDAFEEGAGHIEGQQEGVKVLRVQVARLREELPALQTRGRELELELEHLRQGFFDRYRIDLEQAVPEEGEFNGLQQQQKRLSELHALIDDMGEVNLTAIEEYRELQERSQFLTAQQEDLRQSLAGLQTAITKINRTTRKRFRETFDLVNAKFKEIFPRLFRGGQAELRLTDEEDLLETGIEIIVQPPGKKLQNVTLLSGGEKALTAVALIFSIFLIKPSPFCMLDEVDAPLDDGNISRFNEMVAEMSAVSQFIIITHNKRTMEIADTLYGVTMEEPGVSKLVSVRINEY